jgi:hypothetical protein
VNATQQTNIQKPTNQNGQNKQTQPTVQTNMQTQPSAQTNIQSPQTPEQKKYTPFLKRKRETDDTGQPKKVSILEQEQNAHLKPKPISVSKTEISNYETQQKTQTQTPQKTQTQQKAQTQTNSPSLSQHTNNVQQTNGNNNSKTGLQQKTSIQAQTQTQTPTQEQKKNQSFLPRKPTPSPNLKNTNTTNINGNANHSNVNINTNTNIPFRNGSTNSDPSALLRQQVHKNIQTQTQTQQQTQSNPVIITNAYGPSSMQTPTIQIPTSSSNLFLAPQMQMQQQTQQLQQKTTNLISETDAFLNQVRAGNVPIINTQTQIQPQIRTNIQTQVFTPQIQANIQTPQTPSNPLQLLLSNIQYTGVADTLKQLAQK